MLEKDYAIPRRSERRPLRKAVVLLVEGDEETTSRDATTVDVSQHGARIESCAELRPGQVLHLIRPENPTDTVRCLVVWTADVSADANAEAGLEFLQPYTSPLEN
jgi:PilZ domain